MKNEILTYSKRYFQFYFGKIYTYVILSFVFLLLFIEPVINMVILEKKFNFENVSWTLNYLNSFYNLFWIIGSVIFAFFVSISLFSKSNEEKISDGTFDRFSKKSIIISKYILSIFLILVISMLIFVIISITGTFIMKNMQVNPLLYAFSKSVHFMVAGLSLVSIFVLFTLFLKRKLLKAILIIMSIIIVILSTNPVSFGGESLEIYKLKNSWTYNNNFKNELHNKNYFYIENEKFSDIEFYKENKIKVAKNMQYIFDFNAQWSNAYSLLLTDKRNIYLEMSSLSSISAPAKFSEPMIEKNIENNNLVISVEGEKYCLLSDYYFSHTSKNHVNLLIENFIKRYDVYPTEVKNNFKTISYASMLVTIDRWIYNVSMNNNYNHVPNPKSHLTNENIIIINGGAVFVAEMVRRHFELNDISIFNTSEMYTSDENGKAEIPMLNIKDYTFFKFEMRPYCNTFLVYSIWSIFWICSLLIYSLVSLKKVLK